MKKLLIALIALAILGAIVFGVRTLGARDEADAVGSKEAAELVDTGDGGEQADIEAGERPEPGTYTYTGSGEESVDALGGSKHTFPDEIAAVVELDAEDDCRWTSNVIYIKQHVEERRFCTKGTVMTDLGFTRKIEFFNQLQTTGFTCDDDAERLRADSQEGDTWSWTCSEGIATTSKYTTTFLGKETLTVGGEQIDTFHTRVVSKQSGDANGTDTSEFWLADTGFAVKFTADLDVRTKSVLGDTHFKERASYALTSLVPSQG